MCSATKRKNKTLTFGEKKALLDAIDAGGKLKQEIATEFQIPKSTLSTIIKNRDKLVKSIQRGSNTKKRLRLSSFPAIEKCLYEWFVHCRDKDIPITGPILREKAVTFAKELSVSEFRASNGWLINFRKRYGISFCEESASLNVKHYDSWKNSEHILHEEPVTLTQELGVNDLFPNNDWEHNFRKRLDIDSWKETLPNLLKNYESGNIFNAQLTGLYYKCTPKKVSSLKGELCHAGELSKERLTLLLCANMDGSDKLPPLLIGNAKNPRCFAGVRSLPVAYTSNKYAWMTSDIFSAWLLEIDQIMTEKKRKIILFLDNRIPHHDVLELTSVTVEFFPFDNTSILQPLDLGIIRNVKTLYRTAILKKILEDTEEGNKTSVNVLQAVRTVDKAWREITPSTIQKCFKKADFIDVLDESPADEILVREHREAQNLWSKVIEKNSDLSNISMSDYFEVDAHVSVCHGIREEHVMLVEDDDMESSDDEQPASSTRCSYREARSVIQRLRSFIEGCPNVYDSTFGALAEIENCVEAQSKWKQSSIFKFNFCKEI